MKFKAANMVMKLQTEGADAEVFFRISAHYFLFQSN